RWTNFPARIRLSALALGQIAGHVAGLDQQDRAGLAARGSELASAAEDAFAEAGKRGRPVGPEGIAWSARASAEHVRLRWLLDVDPPGEDALLSSWRTAAEAFERFGHPFELARTRARLAAVLRMLGNRTEARGLVESARVTAERLGARPLLTELAAISTAAPNPQASKRDQQLTRRELEVLRLAAQGRSNGEIARQLFI